MAETCTHMDQIEFVEVPETIAGCEECLRDRRTVAAPADVHDVRPHRLLRLVAQPARDRARARERPSGHPLGGARRGLVLVLRGRGGVHGRRRRRRTAVSSQPETARRRPAGAAGRRRRAVGGARGRARPAPPLRPRLPRPAGRERRGCARARCASRSCAAAQVALLAGRSAHARDVGRRVPRGGDAARPGGEARAPDRLRRHRRPRSTRSTASRSTTTC